MFCQNLKGTDLKFKYSKCVFFGLPRLVLYRPCHLPDGLDLMKLRTKAIEDLTRPATVKEINVLT